MSKEIYEYINQDYVDSLTAAYEAFNAETLGNNELCRCQSIARRLINIFGNGFDLQYYQNSRPEKVFNEAIDNFYAFGDDRIIRKASSFLNNVKKQYVDDENPTRFTLFSELTKKCDEYYKEPKILYSPQLLADYSSPFLCHEIAHGIKDVNPEENKSIRTKEEIVPMLVELITAYEKTNDINLFKNVCRSRIDLILNNCYRIVNSYNALNSGKINADERRLYTFAIHEDACYINSFYYVTGLFNLYLKDNLLVLNALSAVLNGEMTTEEMISKLEKSFYGYDEGFSIGIDRFKRITQ